VVDELNLRTILRNLKGTATRSWKLFLDEEEFNHLSHFEFTDQFRAMNDATPISVLTTETSIKNDMRKHDTTSYFCIDYRKLNSARKKGTSFSTCSSHYWLPELALWVSSPQKPLKWRYIHCQSDKEKCGIPGFSNLRHAVWLVECPKHIPASYGTCCRGFSLGIVPRFCKITILDKPFKRTKIKWAINHYFHWNFIIVLFCFLRDVRIVISALWMFLPENTRLAHLLEK